MNELVINDRVYKIANRWNVNINLLSYKFFRRFNIVEIVLHRDAIIIL